MQAAAPIDAGLSSVHSPPHNTPLRCLRTVDALEAPTFFALSWVEAFFACTPKKFARDTFGLNLLAILWLMLLLLRACFFCVFLTGADRWKACA